MLTWAIRIFVSLQDPTVAAEVAAEIVDEPRMVRELRRICKRESHCRPISIHDQDAWASRRVYLAASRAGLVDPGCQPYEAGAWSTRGAWGLMAAYHVHRTGLRCLPPSALDIPLVSALAAARKLRDMCEQDPEDRHPASARWGRCDWKRPRGARDALNIGKDTAQIALASRAASGVDFGAGSSPHTSP